MKKKMIILGTGALAVEIAELAQELPDLELAGFAVNELPYEPGTSLLGKPVYWIEELGTFSSDYVAVCALMRMRKTRIIQQAVGYGISFCNLIHQSAILSPSVTLGTGNIIKAGAVIGPQTTIGSHVIIGTGAILSDVVKVKDYSVISIGAMVAGFAAIGTCCLLGMGSMVLEGRSVGDYSIVGAGSLVTRHLPERVKAIGTPAVIVEREINGF